jgi:DNA (cytosine-5)-methyltransferase 1
LKKHLRIGEASLFSEPPLRALGRGLHIDVFAGAGGASVGIARVLGECDIAINHSRQAVEMHAINHPSTHHLCGNVWDYAPRQVTSGLPVDFAWFSPDCTHFSNAKGAKPLKKRIRALAWIVTRWCQESPPALLMLENVPEFRHWGPLDRSHRPIKARRGETFKRWIATIRKCGYEVEWRLLKACDYNAPTKRKRLFLIARRDGNPIVWPLATRGPASIDRLPYRTGAECIDWSLPLYSIFLTRAQAKRYGIKRPLKEKSMRRIAQGVKRYVLDDPEPFIVNVQHAGDEFRGQPLTQPMPTITAKHGFGLVAPLVCGIGGAEYAAKPTRVDRPLNTVMPCDRRAIVAAFMVKYFGGVVGQRLDEPMPTITARDHNAVAVASLVQFRGTNKGKGDLRQPMPAITAGGLHLGQAVALLAKYYGTGVARRIDQPLDTITAKDRFGIITVGGEQHCLGDIYMRMFRARELANAQGFPPDYILIGTHEQQVAMIGNSVPPDVAEALVRANVPPRNIQHRPAEALA